MLGVPIITQSDPGTENYGVANTHTIIRHRLDPSLANSMQHRFAPGHNNILSEIRWSAFRRDFAPGFEDELQKGVDCGWYNYRRSRPRNIHVPTSAKSILSSSVMPQQCGCCSTT